MKPTIEVKQSWPWQGLSRRSQVIIVLLIYAALTIVMTWPIAGRLGTHIPGRDGDAWVHLWTFRWLRDALISGQNPYFTDLLFFPNGTSLYSHNIAWVNFAIWLPLQALFGDVVAYSLAYLAVVVLNGIAGYLLIRELTGSLLGAFVGGLIIAFWPYALSHQDHPNLILIAWICLALLFLKRFLEHKRWLDLVLTALFIALIGITRWQVLIMGGFIIGLYLLYRIVSDRIYRSASIMGLLVLMGLLALLFMLPFLLPIAGALSGDTVPTDLFVENVPDSTDLLSYVLPSRYHPLWGEAVSGPYDRFPVRSVVPFLGYTAILLVIIGTALKWQQARIWLLIMLIIFILAIGPRVLVNGTDLKLPTPFLLIADSFFIKIVRRPTRFNAVLSIPFAILASYGIMALSDRLGFKWQTAVLVSMVVVLILVEYIVTFPTFSSATPAWYTELAQEPGHFGIVDVPMNRHLPYYKEYMFYQDVHGKPIVQGHISRVPPEASSFISQVPLLRKVRFEKMKVLAGEMSSVSEQLDQLAAADIRYLVLHKQFLSKGELTSWQTWLSQEPYHEDLDLAVYRTEPLLGRDFSLAHQFNADPDGETGIGLIRATATPTETIQGGTLQVALNWYTETDVEVDYDVCLGLADENDQLIESYCEPLAPALPTSNWRAGELLFTEHSFDVSPYLDAGRYTVTIALAEDSGEYVGDVASAGSVTNTAVPRDFSVPEPSMKTDVTWEDAIELPGYELSFPDNSLAVRVFWLAKQRMDTSYTNFFHLVDPETGETLTQADVIPRGWTYPTLWWEQGELVEDTVLLSLEGVSPGEYELYTGWYDMETGDRLLAYSPSGEPLSDRIMLTTIQR